MRGITIIFNNEKIHTGEDLDLVQEVKEIGKPTVQSHTVEVPGRNGLLNLTKALTGEVTYFNRTLTFRYFCTGTRERMLEVDAILSALHGETVKIIDDDTPDYYYEGEMSVSTIPNTTYITFEISVNALPFRYKLEETSIAVNVNGETIISVVYRGHSVTPYFTTDSAITIIKDGLTSHQNNVKRGRNYDMKVKNGNNVFTLRGNGNIIIQYREEVI